LKADGGDAGDEGDARLWEPVTERIIWCVFRVANLLGVEDWVIVKFKVAGGLSEADIPQHRNDLRATGKPQGEPLCLLINFGRPKVEVHRITPSLACWLAQS
jgi:hypothetical protein